MTVSTPETKLERLREGLRYLRRHALEAHQAGDGVQVIHCSSLALKQCEEFGKAHPDHKLQMREIRWAFTLGMYWIINEWFLMLVRSALEQTDCAGVNSTDQDLVVLIHNRLHQPQNPLCVTDVDPIPIQWWEQRGGINAAECEEDRIALTFVIELVWYTDPDSDDWRRLLAGWLESCPVENAFHSRLTQLKARLDFQAELYSGRAFQPCDEGKLPIEEPVQRDLFRAWIAYFNCNWQQLTTILNHLKYSITVEHPAYIPFHNLQRWSLVHRPKPDDQFISLPRLQLARSRQPAQMFQHFRESYATQQFLSVANAGFPQNAKANERLACLRMAMLVSLQALRTWDIGTWMYGLQQRAQSRLELGTQGDVHSAVAGILDSVRGHSVPDPEKSARFAHCLQLLDAIDVEQRRSVTRMLLESPPVEWRDAHTILCELSDAIPEDVHSELARWSLRVESTDLLKNHWTPTLMDVWNEILHRSSKRDEISEQLAPVLRQVVTKPMLWDKLHATIVAAILYGPVVLANELIDLLVNTECRIALESVPIFDCLRGIKKQTRSRRPGKVFSSFRCRNAKRPLSASIT